MGKTSEPPAQADNGNVVVTCEKLAAIKQRLGLFAIRVHQSKSLSESGEMHDLVCLTDKGSGLQQDNATLLEVLNECRE